MPFARTAALRGELERALPRRPFAVRFWDGTAVQATEQPAPTFTIRSPQALAHLLRAPGELGLGRAYALGLIETDDIDAALLLVDSLEPPPLRPWAIGRLVVGARAHLTVLDAPSYLHLAYRPGVPIARTLDI